MITIEPKKLYRDAYFYSRRNNLSDVVYLYDSKLSVYRLNNDIELSKAGVLPPASQIKYNTVSFHPSLEMVVVILSDQSVAVCDFNGNIWNHHAGYYKSVLYSRDGRFIWAIEKRDKQNLRITVLDHTGVILTQHEMEDELYDSSPLLSDIPKSDKLILELAAGQDGILLYECDYTNSINIKKFLWSNEFPNSSFITPAWSPDGSKMFTLENDMQTYASFTYPQIKLLSEQTDGPDDEDQMPGYNMIYLKNGLLIVQDANNRHYLFDPINMKPLEEIVFQGLEPVPVNQVYTNLKDDYTLYSRIVYFDRVSNHLLAARTDERHDEPLTIFIHEDTLMECT